MSKITAIVLAAGNGSRMQSSQKKQYMEIYGRPVLWYSLNAFEKSPVDEIILVTGKDDIAYCRTEIVERYGFKKVAEIVAGGAERYESVYNGLKVAGGDIVLIHDGARPMITPEIINRNIEGVKNHKACVTGVPVKDTIKIVENHQVVETPKRDALWITQTPQSFETLLIKEAYKKMMRENEGNADDEKCIGVTDDAMVVEQYTDTKVCFVMGDYKNIKITTPEDLQIAEVFVTGKDAEKGSQK